MSVSLIDVLGAYSALESHAYGDFIGDNGLLINNAITNAVNARIPNGVIYIPPGTHRIVTPIAGVSNITLIGMGPATVLKLAESANTDVIQIGSGISNFNLINLKIDGNRSSQSSTSFGIWANGCSDCLIENVQVANCYTDGIQLNQTTRGILKAAQCSGNGRHGIGLNGAEYATILTAICYDNCKVATSGTGDGINLDILSNNIAVIAPTCYETAGGAGARQGYGIREQAGSGCFRNRFVAWNCFGNKLGDIYSDGDNTDDWGFAGWLIGG